MKKFLKRKRERKAKKKLKQKIRGLGEVELPVLPRPVMRGLEMLRSGASLASVGQEVASDPRCSVRALTLANSSVSGTRRAVETVPHAAALMGREKLEVLLIGAAVSTSLPTAPSKHFDPTAFWRLAAKRAALARELSARTNPVDKMLSFTIALLQDLAVPMLVTAHGEKYGEVLAQWRAERCDLHELEAQVFEWDHSDVGFELAKAWQLPDRLREGVGDHHGANAPPAVALVAPLGEGTDQDDIARLVEAARTEFAISSDETLEMLKRAEEEADSMVGALRG